MTALSIVQGAASRLGLTAPTVVFASTDAQIIQLRNLMNEEGVELSRAYPWTRLVTEKTFSTTAAAIQTGAVPTDFNWYLDDTMWNRTTRVKLAGPVSAEEWQSFQAISLLSIPQSVFRFRGGDLLIYPTPTAAQTVAYEYGSTYWVSGSKTAFSADTDTALLDENLITLGLRWRFKAAKGFDYAEDFATYQIEKQKVISRDGGRRRVYLGGYPRNPWNANIPESSWNQ
jgi:hypothetical protein